MQYTENPTPTPRIIKDLAPPTPIQLAIHCSSWAWRGSFFKRRHGVSILGIVARPGRELTVAQSPQLTAQGLDADPDAELLPDPLRQVHQTPTDNAMGRRIGPLSTT